MKVLLTTLLVWALALVGAQQCGPRVRKNWNALTAQEKSTYIGSLQAAMDSGAYIKFVEMHTEMMSEMEAHGQCMFIYWHRLMLLVFENMLRGQGAQYACVTVPYWDWITDNSRFTNGQCRSLGGCSSVLTELGGVSGGMRQSTLVINGVTTQGFCMNTSPLNHFCESSNVQGNRCARCIPRGNWNGVGVSGTASYASVMNQLFSATSIGQMSPNLERGAHNNIHSDLDGAMATFASPSDPVFWSHHAMVDLLHVTFHKCRVGTARLTFEQKASHSVAWTSCGRRNGPAFNPTDVVTMRTGVNGRNPINGAQDPVIGRFFQGVPNRFADLMDTRDLGTFSYSYELSGVTATMYTQCDGRPAPAPAPVPVPAPQPVPVPIPAPRPVPMPIPAPRPVPAPRPGSWFSWWPIRWGRSLRADTLLEISDDTGVKVKAANAAVGVAVFATNPAAQVAPPAPAANRNPVPDSATSSAKQTDVATAQEAVIINTSIPCDPSVQKVMDWYNEMVDRIGGPSQKSQDEIERMMCVFQDECLGGVKDFTAEFKRIWGNFPPRCKAIVDEVHSGKQSICIADWKQAMTQRFGCPQPTKSSSSYNMSPVQSTTTTTVVTTSI